MVQKVLHEFYGVSEELYYQRDGSGMSRLNRIVPNGLIKLFDAISAKANAGNFISYLPRLPHFFDGTPAQGLVHAKTGISYLFIYLLFFFHLFSLLSSAGFISVLLCHFLFLGTLTGVNALSGYLIDPNQSNEKILFSIMIEDAKPNPTPVTKQIIADLVIILAKYYKNISA
jgi:D-alanyl-D-alanine carboxypeptidase